MLFMLLQEFHASVSNSYSTPAQLSSNDFTHCDDGYCRAAGNLPPSNPPAVRKFWEDSSVSATAGMASLWLCVDPLPGRRPRRPKRGRGSQGGSVYLGIFTDDPVNIAKFLPRPLTPCVPAPTDDVPMKTDVWRPPAVPADAQCESPPAEIAEGGEPERVQVRSGISIF